MKKIWKVVAIGLCAAMIVPTLNELQVFNTSDKTAMADAGSADGTFQGIVINAGKNETELNFTWYDNVIDDGTVYMAEKTEDASKLDETGFPIEVQLTAEAEQEKVKYTSGNSKYYADYEINKATITGVKRGVDYVYRVGNGDEYSEIYDFKVKGTKANWSFYFATDPQLPNVYGSDTGNTHDASDTTVVKRWVSSVDKIVDLNPEGNLLVCAGDLAHNGGGEEAEYIDGFLKPEKLHNMTVAATVGNHDQHTSGIPYSEHFNQPNQTDIGKYNNTPGDYYYTYNNALFIHLTSSVRNDINAALTHVDDHIDFIKEALEENPDTDWHIIVFHEALFSGGWHATEDSTRKMRQILCPLLDEIDQEYGIDLVLNGHDHYYTRTYLMQGTEVVGGDVEDEMTDPDGIIWITGNTGSGVLYNDPVKVDYEYQAVSVQEYTPNISNIDIRTTPDETSLNIVTYRTCEGPKYKGNADSMSVVDDFTIKKTIDTKKNGEAVKLVDNNNKITWNIPNIFSQDSAVLSSKKITSGANYDKLVAGIKNDAVMKNYDTYNTVFDIKADWCSEDLVLGEKTEMFIPLPNDVPASFEQVKDNNNTPYFTVYGLDAAGNAVKVNAAVAVKDGVKGALFNTDKAGAFVVSLAGVDKNKAANDSNANNSGTANQGADNAKPVKVSKLKVNKKKVTLKRGKKFTIKVKVTPANATNKKLKYKTSNKKIAKVSKKGVITAVKKGKAVITVSAADGSKKSAKITVKVK